MQFGSKLFHLLSWRWQWHANERLLRDSSQPGLFAQPQPVLQAGRSAAELGSGGCCAWATRSSVGPRWDFGFMWWLH